MIEVGEIIKLGGHCSIVIDNDPNDPGLTMFEFDTDGKKIRGGRTYYITDKQLLKRIEDHRTGVKFELIQDLMNYVKNNS